MVKKRAGMKLWRSANVAHLQKYQQKWKSENQQRIRDYQNRRYKEDPAFRLAAVVRSRILDALRQARAGKSNRSVKLLGCDVQFLMGYLEARFKPGMSWTNYGAVWEIDHHIPLASYDLTDSSHQRSAFHYSNLRPLFRPENMSKGAKMPPPHQAELI